MNEFTPGDVVVHPKYGRGIVQTKGFVEFADVGDYADLRDVAADLRRLVVIDPEDRAQVERLVRAFPDEWGFEQDEEAFRECTEDVQAALREFANPKPPKPAEPTGLGAVVEDAEGSKWVRSERWPEQPWDPCGVRDGGFPWEHIDAVRVLSEGVQP